MMQATMPSSMGFRRVISQPLNEKSAILEAAISLTCGLEEIETFYDAKVLDAAASEYRSGVALRNMLVEVAYSNGHQVNQRDVGEMLRGAFARPLYASGFSTLSLPGILSNVANKFLLSGFNSVESAWREITAVKPVADFKQITNYTLLGDTTFEQVGPAGEIKHASLSEGSYTNQAATYGRIIGVSRRDIIDDNLSAITSAPRRLGRGAALKMNDLFWTAFLGGVGSMWTSGHANLITGGSSALSATSLALAASTFRKQTDPDGKPLGLNPAILLVPPELEVVAKGLMNAQFFNTGGASTESQVPNANTWQGAYKVAVSTYLSNTSYTGNSATAWWLLANPLDLASIECVFLGGRETPIIDSADADMSQLGIFYRGVFDAGVALQEYRAGVRSAGA